MDLVNKRVTIIGAQRSGFALASLVIHLKGIPRISEVKSRDCLDHKFNKWLNDRNIEAEWGGHSQSFVENSDIVVLSPGVSMDSPPVHWAKKKGILVFGEIEFAWKFCNKPIIAVTGSNGKTTVVTLIKKVLERSGYHVCLCGNVGTPFSQCVLDLKDKDYIVLETSSFQLESIIDFKPYIAVFLNFSQNHLDRHRDLQEYFNAKMKIFSNQDESDYAVLNSNDFRAHNLISQMKAQISYYNTPDIMLKTKIYNPNYLAVVEVARILDIDLKVCQEVFQKFTGVEHRFEWICSINGIDFINDSKATTAEASRWALNNVEKPVFMICGGRDKNIDFSVLKDLVRDKVEKMFLIGEAREKIKRIFQGVVSIEDCQFLEKAILRAYESAREGDCVLFSPMCASFDMFSDFEERGKTFKKLVRNLG